MSKKTAIVLFNIGGPDKPEAIKPFLTNFFSDPNIIRLPGFLRGFVARRIAARRSQGEALTAYTELGGKSPLLENTHAQGQALEMALQQELGAVKVFLCMRYWHPMSDAVVQDVKVYGPDRIFLLPLYPQFSTTTTRSSFQDWDRAVLRAGLTVPTTRVCCYPFNDGFIAASADLLKQSYQTARDKDSTAPLRVLFSAHGLPENIIKGGDPYQWQCEQTAQKIVDAMGIQALDWQVCYQSRVGPLKWIGPSTEEALQNAADDKVGVIIYPHAFVSEHVETLVEIEKEYRHMARDMGVPGFYRVPAVSTHPDFIAGLADEVMKNIDGGAFERLCPETFKQCYCARG